MASVISCFLPGVEYDRAAQGLLGAGEKLARDLGTSHVVVCAGSADSLLQNAGKHADRVMRLQCAQLSADRPESCLSSLHAACEGLDAKAIESARGSYGHDSHAIPEPLGMQLDCSSKDQLESVVY